MQDVVIAVVRKGTEFSFLQRIDGRWTFPSGKVELGESFEEALRREVTEESGLIVNAAFRLGDRRVNGEILHFYGCDWQEGELKVGEPDNFLVAEWKTAQQIFDIVGESKMFPPVVQFLREAVTCSK